MLEIDLSLVALQPFRGLPMRLSKSRMMLAALLLVLLGSHPIGSQAVRHARSAAGLAYDVVGDGPGVVLIHGTNLDRRMWDGEVAWLQQHARVIRYDLRGQGASDDPTRAYSNHADLISLLDELGEREVTLIGLSAGAQVALDVALEAPERVRRMVLASPSLSGYVPDEMPPFFTDLGAALQAQDFQRANEVLLASPIMSVPPEFADLVQTMVVDNTRLWSLPYSLLEQVSPPALERLEAVRPSTLVLVGADDLAAIHDQARLLAQRMADARLVTLPGGGHLLNMTSAEAFREAVGEFLGLARN